VPWIAASAGLLLAGLAGPSFVAKIFFSNMADASTGAVLVVLAASVCDWVIAEGRARVGAALTGALICIALVNLRQANVALLGLSLFGVLFAALTGSCGTRPLALASFAVVAVPALALAYLWGRYAAVQIPGGDFSILPVNAWRWDLLPAIASSMTRVMIAKTGLFALILGLIVRLAWQFRRGAALPAADRAGLSVAVFACAGMIGFLGFTYLAANFSRDEAIAAASFWRYMGETGPLAVFGAAVSLPVGWWRRVPVFRTAVALVAVTLVLPLATVRMYRADLVSPVPHLREMAQAIDRAVPRSAPVMLVDLTGDGFAPIVVNYELTVAVRNAGLPPRQVTIDATASGITPAEAELTDFRAVPYVWLAEGAVNMTPILGPPLSAGCSYLLRSAPGGLAVADRWAIGRIRWSTVPAGWSTAVEPGCS
jgi:hypothetical protein